MLYNQKTADLYTRAYNITIENPLGYDPFIRFNEERVEVTAEGPVSLGKGGEHVAVTFAPDLVDTQFTVYNPETGEAVGTTTYGELQATVYSLYLHLCATRDNSPLEEV